MTLRPKGLAGTPAEIGGAAACVAALVALFLIDVLTPSAVTVSGLFALPAAAAAWLLRGWLALAVTALALALLGFLAFQEVVPPLTATSRVLSVLLIAAFGHLAAVSTLDAREVRERRLHALLELGRRLGEAATETEVATVLAEAAARSVSHGGPRQQPRGSAWALEAPDRLRAIAESASRAHLRSLEVTLDGRMRRFLAGSTAEVFAVMELPVTMQDALQAAGVREVAMAPIRVAGEPWGMVSAGALDEKPFSREEVDVLAGMAELAGLALRGVRAGGAGAARGRGAGGVVGEARQAREAGEAGEAREAGS